MLRLALDLRPDFAAARLLAADILAEPASSAGGAAHAERGAGHRSDLPVVQLRRAALVDRLGRSDEAMRDLERMARDYPDSPLPDSSGATSCA